MCRAKQKMLANVFFVLLNCGMFLNFLGTSTTPIYFRTLVDSFKKHVCFIVVLLCSLFFQPHVKSVQLKEMLQFLFSSESVSFSVVVTFANQHYILCFEPVYTAL